MDQKKLPSNVSKKEVIARKLLLLKGSLYLCLPKNFCNRHQLKAGDKVMVGIGENLLITPLPAPFEGGERGPNPG